MSDNPFLFETSNNQVQRIITVFIIAIFLLFGLAIIVANLTGHTFMGLQIPKIYVPDLVNDITLTKLFLITFIGGLIFFPVPTEIAFYFSVVQGNDPLLCILVAVVGAFLGNASNYFIGYKLTKQVMYLLSAKNFFKVRRQVNKWGAYAIFFMNLIPSPSDVLGVCLGTINYSKRRFLLISTIGTILKFAIIAYAAINMKGVF